MVARIEATQHNIGFDERWLILVLMGIATRIFQIGCSQRVIVEQINILPLSVWNFSLGMHAKCCFGDISFSFVSLRNEYICIVGSGESQSCS